MSSVEKTKDAVKKVKDVVASKEVADATFDELVAKPRRVHVFTVHIPDGEGGSVPRKITYQAISQTEYDALLAAHPPVGKDKGTKVYNEETFPAALIAAVSLRPKMTEEQADTLLRHDAWAPGEVASLFTNAWALCNADFSVSFSASD